LPSRHDRLACPLRWPQRSALSGTTPLPFPLSM
jgi:hypothetical protein